LRLRPDFSRRRRRGRKAAGLAERAAGIRNFEEDMQQGKGMMFRKKYPSLQEFAKDAEMLRNVFGEDVLCRFVNGAGYFGFSKKAHKPTVNGYVEFLSLIECD
jgi:hypothetical protein